MLREKLMREVAVPIWYGVSNLAKLSVSEEALYAYLSIVTTLVVFLVECWDESISTARWAVGSLIDLNEPEVGEIYIDENLYLMASHESWEVLGADVMEVVNYWQGKASKMFDVVDTEFWSEGCVPQLEERELAALPPYRKRVGVKFIG